MTAAAQHEPAGIFRVSPYLGYWIPLGVVQQDIENGRTVRRSQVGDLLAGIRAGFTIGRGWSIEGGATLTPGHVARTDSTGTADLPGLAVAAVVRLLRVGRLAGEFDGLVGVGAGVINRSRSGWQGTIAAPSIVLALGLQTHIAGSSAFRAEMEVHASRSRRPGGGGSPPWRGDVVLSFGIVTPAPRR